MSFHDYICLSWRHYSPSLSRFIATLLQWWMEDPDVVTSTQVKVSGILEVEYRNYTIILHNIKHYSICLELEGQEHNARCAHDLPPDKYGREVLTSLVVGH